MKHDLSTTEASPSEIAWDEKADRRILRKCDLHVLPIFYILYMLSYLDRINIGNARIEGLERDLGMSGNDYNIAIQVFFVPYILLEVPSNIALRHVAPSTWLSASCRFLLGLFEAGLAPGALYLITMYYKRYELQKRYTFYNTAENAKFLNDDERSLLVRRLKDDISYAKMDHLNKGTLKRILGDWKMWTGGLMYLGTCASNYSVAYYLPTVLNELGYRSSEAQVQTIPIYAAGFVFALAAAWSSDRLHHRFGFVILGAAINILGYGVLLAQSSVSVRVRYMSLYFVVIGLWIGSPVEIVWIAGNLGGHYKRAIGSAIQNAMGNISGFIASNVFITNQSPRYPVGYGVALAMSVVAAAAATTLFLGYRGENTHRDRRGRDYRLEESEVRGNDLGDDHPGYRYAT
ncbi:MAG: hypothetical protein Q9186_007075 [Xanthomendoza sp. 1 TL-2023]